MRESFSPKDVMWNHLCSLIFGNKCNINVFEQQKVLKKEATASKPSSSKRKARDKDEEGSKKKPKKKKDPNAPKRGMSAFMFFSNAEREARFIFLC